MIKLQGINKQFADRLILKDVNLEIKRGEIFGLIGLSGAGKSTLLRIINQLEVQTSGTVDYEKKLSLGLYFKTSI